MTPADVYMILASDAADRDTVILLANEVLRLFVETGERNFELKKLRGNMRVTLTFDTSDPDQKQELEEIQAVRKLAGAVDSLLRLSREMVKYRVLSEESVTLIDELRSVVYAELEGYEP